MVYRQTHDDSLLKSCVDFTLFGSGVVGLCALTLVSTLAVGAMLGSSTFLFLMVTGMAEDVFEMAFAPAMAIPYCWERMCDAGGNIARKTANATGTAARKTVRTFVKPPCRN